jgi:glycosyltransferase involved in cell wall biosynthesis
VKIAFVTTYDAEDVNSWSGTPYYMSKAFIDAGLEVEFIGSLKNCPLNLAFRFRELLYNKILKKKFGGYYRDIEPRALRYLAKQVNERLQRSEVDIILSPGAWPIAYLEISKPIVLWTDATFANSLGYYPGLTELNRLTKENFHKYERNVLRHASLSCFSSEWAARTAIDYYKADCNRVKVVPFGANLDSTRTINDIIQFSRKKKRDQCELLFVGKEWERKGGDIAIKIADILNKGGLKTILHLVGIKELSLNNLPGFVINHGFLSKAIPEERDKIEELFSQSHFFVLPTRADCTPMVFPEANSFGLPIITFNTGGISSIITDEINGKMFDPAVETGEITEYIKCLFSDIDRYNRLSLTAFNEYETKLNWNTSIAKMIFYFNKILAKNSFTSKSVY